MERMSRYQELELTLTNHRPSDEQVERIEALRANAKILGHAITKMVPPSRQQSLALTHLEDCVMRAVQGVVLEGVTHGAANQG